MLKESDTKFEQVFDSYKITIDQPSLEINVINIESKVVWIHIKNNAVSWCRRLPVDGTQAFELANMYQEALSLANTKKLSVDLLLELGYNVIE